MTWARLQDELNRCAECLLLGTGLFTTTEASPARPPDPPGESLLFISEAPPPAGGFWRAASDDALRDSLRRILDDSDARLSTAGARAWLDEFVRRGFFLVQAIKCLARPPFSENA